jgi:DNA-binding transcriptional MerR regulator
LSGVEDDRYGIEELARLGGVTRRTVRYYVQEGLLPAPLGVGRGRHYGLEHLAQLRQVKALQEQGRTLDEVRRELSRPRRASGKAAARVSLETAGSLPSAWTRLEVLPGVEIHVSARHRLPSAGRLAELAEWCRRHLGPTQDGDA